MLAPRFPALLIISLLSYMLLLHFCYVHLICSPMNNLNTNLFSFFPPHGIMLFLPSSSSVSGSRLSQSVTVEEDNCCGCNVLAIRRQFLDQDLKQVHIVYTSCHDAVSISAIRNVLRFIFRSEWSMNSVQRFHNNRPTFYLNCLAEVNCSLTLHFKVLDGALQL